MATRWKDCDIQQAIFEAAQRLGFASVREVQAKAITSIVAGKDVFVSLPTGTGKSLCFALVPLVFDRLFGYESGTERSIAIVVSPLIALMKDQVASFASRGLSVAFMCGENEREDLMLIEGKYRLIFVSPESIMTNLRWREVLRSNVYQQHLVVFAVDEAHCVPKWGHFFRKEFSRLGEVRSLIPRNCPLMALTATATTQTRNSIVKILGMVDPHIICISPHKPNILYWIAEKGGLQETFQPLIDKLRVQRIKMERVLIFCRRYEECADIYELFKCSLGIDFTEPIGSPNLSVYRLVDMYTSITQKEVKDTILKAICNPMSHLRVVICTISFGMGINCPDIRQVIHWGPSEDIEAYIQETGRAGRDGKLSCALLFVSKTDFTAKGRYRKVNSSMLNYCKVQSCRRSFLLSEFDPDDQPNPTGCSCCDICASECVCTNCRCSSFIINLSDVTPFNIISKIATEPDNI